MRNPFKKGTLYAFYFSQLTRKRPPSNAELEILAQEKFPGRKISRGAIQVFRSKLRAGTMTGVQVEVPASNRR